MPSSPSTRRPPPEIDDFEEDEELPKKRGQEITKQLLLDLAGRWHWIFLGLLIGVISGLYYVSKAPKVYQATATVLVKQRTATVMSRDQVEEMDLGSSEGLNTVGSV